MQQIYFKTTDNPGEYELVRDFHHRGHIVPKGFRWDGASVPRPLWFVVPRLYKTAKASCLHDFLCRNAKSGRDRLAADKLLRLDLVDAFKPRKPDNPNIIEQMQYLLELASSYARSWVGFAGVRIGALCGVGVYY